MKQAKTHHYHQITKQELENCMAELIAQHQARMSILSGFPANSQKTHGSDHEQPNHYHASEDYTQSRVELDNSPDDLDRQRENLLSVNAIARSESKFKQSSADMGHALLTKSQLDDYLTSSMHRRDVLRWAKELEDCETRSVILSACQTHSANTDIDILEFEGGREQRIERYGAH